MSVFYRAWRIADRQRNPTPGGGFNKAQRGECLTCGAPVWVTDRVDGRVVVCWPCMRGES